jgi:DNA helicase HerA-like ATPase
MNMPIAKGPRASVELLPSMANRHGLIAGATGTGKTVSLQVLAERFSALGVPVFMADVKGDLAGISQPGGQSPKVIQRVRELGLADYTPAGFPVTLWDVFGEHGHPIRATISELGPLLLARLLQLNETQGGVLNLVFKIADEHGLLLLDLKDLRSMTRYVGENASAFTTQYGNISPASIGAIQRALLALESQGAENFFGEPALNLDDFLQTDPQGRGVINILSAAKLIQSPRLYATLLLWMLSELFERLPEAGDLPKPKLVFFFDEAHLLFNDLPSVLLEKIELVVRLIRSKGVGVYFVTQNPRDIPDAVLGQLGNRIQHALRAFTPADQKQVRSAAQTFRANPDLDTQTVLTQLGVGEALVSLLDDRGQPGIVQRAWILPPVSQIGPIPTSLEQALLANSIVAGVYEKSIDRTSAYETLTGAHAAPANPQVGSTQPVPEAKRGFFASIFGTEETPPAAPKRPSLPTAAPRRGGGRAPEDLGTVMAKSVLRSVGSSIGREIVRGVLGGIFGGGKRR